MDEKLVNIINEMAEYLNIAQMKKLQEVLLKHLINSDVEKTSVSNMEYLQMFIDAKRIEGCSDRTLRYYQVTVEHLLQTVDVEMRKMTTDDLRSYLADYQKINNCSKVTIDNIRRNLSSFFSWLEEEDYILKSPMRRIHKIKTKQQVKEIISDEMIEKMRDNCKTKRDELLSKEWHESELENDELKNYKAKAEYYIRQHQDNEAIAKLKTNQPLTTSDIENLEEILWKEVGSREDYEQEYGEKPLGEFVREIVGLDMNAAKEAFSEYLSDTNMDSRQIYFVNQIVEYIVHNGMMKDLSVLQESPFTDRGSVVEIFTDLSVWMGIRGVIDRINANAAA